jgi:hypothetical protein
VSLIQSNVARSPSYENTETDPFWLRSLKRFSKGAPSNPIISNRVTSPCVTGLAPVSWGGEGLGSGYLE